MPESNTLSGALPPTELTQTAELTRPVRPESIYHMPVASGSVPSFTSTTSATNGKPKDYDMAEGDERGLSHTDSRYARMNRALFLFAATAAVSSINYGWIIGSINIPALVIEECAGGPMTWTNGFPSCIPMSSTLWGLVVGLTPLGAWAGSLLSGIAADRFGRKRMLMYNNAFFVAGALLACLTTSIVQLAAGRFVSGIGCGIAANVVSTYCSEMSTVRSRGFLGGFQQLMILVGVFLSQVVSIGLSKAPLWRALFSISAAIAIVQTLLLLLIPESPKFLTSAGRLDEARASLQRIRGGMDISLELDDLLTTVESGRQNEHIPQPTMWQVLTGKTEIDLRHLVFCALFLMLSQQWSGAKGVMFYSTEILSDRFHLTADEVKEIPTIAQLLTLGIGGIGAVAVIIGMNILDKVGRRSVLIVSSFATSICAALIVVGSALDIGPMVATSMYLFNLVFQAGAGFIPYLCASEMLPYYALGSISGLATSINCLTLFVVSFIFPILDKSLKAYLFVPFIVTNFITCLFGVFLMPEAKGKSVLEVVDEYKGPIRFVAGPFVRRKTPSSPITFSPPKVLD
ncbi:Bifunctional purine biosynthesis protein PurH [Coemansia sp. RSA 1807]|nr:Bifunctional purine biosynthesis protein PurH [Coemansia sp. RSA 1591]KAJ1767079.1 Bifunctional purine biosynthesis protein PurH [Coemansia sp. RSA 1752]KAJ1778718.1 Bifunctional purine biosynthesis protein PurH [Coemansia sp. RSA 1824]KAJ1792514.1 Bifunctional purine biosynthesis protein PurH [Coemansia sp. RSA 2167]KAJ1794621.1 Bifunctional purine biosynthesis protein PurH [Coemansia sp. RSA 1938]KAJ2154169.1 Bifunctional purine biosynthesis protein PurH [Coemansia sp. RSA 637]KAJ2203037